MKVVTICFTNGKQFEAPAAFVARRRAEYYVERDIERGDVAEQEREQALQAEIEYALKEPGEIEDWIGNNMDWKELTEVATEVTGEPYSYEREFSNASLAVVEVVER